MLIPDSPGTNDWCTEHAAFDVVRCPAAGDRRGAFITAWRGELALLHETLLPAVVSMRRYSSPHKGGVEDK